MKVTLLLAAALGLGLWAATDKVYDGRTLLALVVWLAAMLLLARGARTRGQR